MSFEPFQKLCEYYLDYLAEDSTDSLSAFASGRTLSYMTLNEPELSSRDKAGLNNSELDSFRNLFNTQTRGNQRKTWWYGYPVIVKIIKGKSGWQGGIVKPLFVIPIELSSGSPGIVSTIIRINNDAFRDLGLDLEQIRGLADNLGLFDDTGSSNLSQLADDLISLLPNIQLHELSGNTTFANLPFNENTLIYKKGIILAADASKYVQGLEKDLNKLKSISTTQINNSSLGTFFPEINSIKTTSDSFNFDLSEAFELNEQQKETVKSAFTKKLTVVTGPPGTGKSQVVASIVVNAARQNQRVLFASFNHKAVDVVEERLNRFNNQPFILRLGRRGADDRNIQQELISYLNGILGTAVNKQINHQYNQINRELNELYKNRNYIESEIKKYQDFRNCLSKSSEIFSGIKQRIGDKADIIFLKGINNIFSFWDKIQLAFSKDWKDIVSYTRLLKSVPEKICLEEYSLKLARLELQIRNKSKDEFDLWIKDLPTRLNSTQRQIIAEYASKL